MEEPLHYYQVCFNSPLRTLLIYSSSYSNLLYKRVKVSLRNKSTLGFVCGVAEKPENLKIKQIEAVYDQSPIITAEQRELAGWISEQYLSSLGEALGLFFSFKKISNLPTPKKNKKVGKGLPKTRIELSLYQKKKINLIQDKLRGFHPLLIHGVTGSGKTFFYLKLVEFCLSQGRQAIVLVPEISLIFQVHKLCQKVFGELEMRIFHSKMGDRTREDIRDQVRSGKVKLLIATRSGFFLPFKDLGLIILDEEHENSYKNSSTPRYQLKQVVYHWARKKNISLVLVSATPTVDIYYQTQSGIISEVELSERYAQAQTPKIEFFHREEEEKISTTTYREVFKNLEMGKQVLFYINQRGFSSTVVCTDCKHNYRCPYCEITLTFHKNKETLICHYCGCRESFTGDCINCGGKQFQFIKAGTENYLEQIQSRFAGYRVVRFDSDSTNQPKKIQETLNDFREKRIHILVGTQMLIKGHDFKNVGLVVVLAPERYLLLPDYRSGERMFSHIMQVAGRAGRDKKTGASKVIVETDIPHHYALQAAQKQSYKEFYLQEIKNRENFNYPPFCKLIRLVFRGLQRRRVEEFAYQVKEEITGSFGQSLILLGPSPCLLEKHNRYHRWNILLKMKQQNYFLEKFAILIGQWNRNKHVYLEIDVSPVDLF